jgi:hypothetical protein
VRLFDFGDTNNNLGRRYLFFTPHSGAGDFRAAISDADPGFNREEIISAPGNLDQFGLMQIAVVINSTNRTMALYTNGVLVNFRTLTIPLTSVSNVYSFLGKALYPDPLLAGSIDEFRIYDHAVSPAQIAANSAAGPSRINADTGSLLSLELQVENFMQVQGIQQPRVLANYSSASNVVVSGLIPILFESSNTNVLSVSSNGMVMAGGTGMATLTARLGDRSAAVTITVAAPPPVLKHRYSFNGTSGESSAVDSVGQAHGTLMGGAALSGDGRISFNGTDAYVDLPNGIISRLTNATFETWVTWSGTRTWERIFDFGSNSAGEDQQGTGQTYLFLSPRGGSGVARFAITATSGAGENPVLNGPSPLPLNREVHVVVTYNASAQQAKLFINGTLVASGAAPIRLSSINDINNWLGRSNWPDPFFTGSMNEFRIYEGALPDDQVSFSGAAGPNTLGGSAGALRSVQVAVSSNNLFLGGVNASASLLANFQSLSNVNVTTFAGVRFESSNTNVVSVSTNGIVTARAAGTAEIRGSYQGQTNVLVVTVGLAPGHEPAVLRNRFSFSDAPGSADIIDSVSGANGRLMGTGTLDGTKLTLSGTDGYVDLPNGLISSLTNASFEAWITWNGNRVWERVFDFGSNSGGEDAQGTGQSYLFLSPRAGNGSTRFAITTNSGAGELPVLDVGQSAPTGSQIHLAVVYNAAAGAASLYTNGVLASINALAIPLSSIQDVNNWLGRSNWPDPFFTGEFHEFRIYRGSLSAEQVRQNFLAGPENLPGTELPRPQLTISRTGNQLSINWAGTAGEYRLESTTQLGGTWQSVTGGIISENGNNRVTIESSGSQRFFRLVK